MNERFRTTRWSLVLAAGAEDGAAPLAALCEAYWYPLYAWARRRGYAPEEAEDLVQGFFAELLEKGWIGRADPERGRFRGFLVTAFRRHVGHERDRANALRRGGGRRLVSLDCEDAERRYALEPATALTPDLAYDRRWALTVLERTLETLRREMAAAGQGQRFALLAAHLPGGRTFRSLADLAVDLGLSEGAVKTALSRLRARYRACLRAEVADTVASPEDVDAEIADLLAALRANA